MNTRRLSVYLYIYSALLPLIWFIGVYIFPSGVYYDALYIFAMARWAFVISEMPGWFRYQTPEFRWVALFNKILWVTAISLAGCKEDQILLFMYISVILIYIWSLKPEPQK